MTCRTTRVLLVCSLATVAATPTASAHEYWLAPSSYAAARGDTIAITAFAGTGFRGEPKACAPERMVRFEARDRRSVDLRPVARAGQRVWARFETLDAGGTLVAYQSHFAKITLPAAEFDAYLDEEGLTGPRAARSASPPDAAVRERYARCARTWIAGANPGAASPGRALARVTSPAGLPLEIVPLADPALASPLPVRVLWQGRPLAGVQVRAWTTTLAIESFGRETHPRFPGRAVPTDAAVRDSVGWVARAITDARGEASLPIDGAGEWLIAAVHMIPCPDRDAADWESWWASLTFARRP